MSLTLSIVMAIVLASALMSGWTAAQPRRGSILGVRLPDGAWKDGDVAAAVRGYRKRLLFLAAAFLALAVPVALCGRFFVLQFILLLAWTILLMPAYYREYIRCSAALRELRRTKGWEERQKPVVAVDTQVSANRGRMAVSPLWMLPGLALSLVPFLLCAVRREDGAMYLTAACPLIFQAVLWLCRRTFCKSRATAFSEDPAVNRACHYLSIHSWTAFFAAMSAAAGLAGLALYFMTMQNVSEFWFLAFTVGMLLIVQIGVYAVFQKVRRGQNRLLEQSDAEILEKDSECRYRYGFYCNPCDPRIMVPKQLGVGWTFNIGRPVGKVLGFGTLGLAAALIAGILGMFLYMEAVPFRLELDGGQAVVSAPLYGTEFALSEVESVAMAEEIPAGTRTNGAAFGNILLGHFRLNGVGKALVYVHTDRMPCLVIRLPERTIYFTGETPEETQALYQELLTAAGLS